MFVTANQPPDPEPPRGWGTGMSLSSQPGCPEAPLLLTFEPAEDRSSPVGKDSQGQI